MFFYRKPFDPELVKAGEYVITRGEYTVTLMSKIPIDGKYHGLVHTYEGTQLMEWNLEGQVKDRQYYGYDLIMA
jgi:hypothetical protein